MSEVTKLQQDIEDVRGKLTEMEGRLEGMKDKEFPQNGDKCFVVLSTAEVNCFTYDDNYKSHTVWKEMGVILKTEAEAESELESRKVIIELMRCEGRVAYEARVRQYSIWCEDNKAGGTWWDISTTNAFGAVFFDTNENAEAAVNTVGKDRIIAASLWLATRPVY